MASEIEKAAREWLGSFGTPDYDRRHNELEDAVIRDLAQAEAKAPYREQAKHQWQRDELEIDDDATVSISENGAWVQAWVWVEDEEVSK